MRISRDKTDARPGLVGRAARGAAVCVAVALLSGCGGWPYIGAVSSTVSPLYAPQYSPPVQQGYIPYPQPLWPSPPPPPPARPDMGDDVAAPQSPAGVVPQGDPASLLPVPPVAQLPTLVPADPRTKTPTTELPPVGPVPPPPTPPAGEDDACVGAWRICHFL